MFKVVATDGDIDWVITRGDFDHAGRSCDVRWQIEDDCFSDYLRAELVTPRIQVFSPA